jgi:hypothetical protein
MTIVVSRLDNIKLLIMVGKLDKKLPNVRIGVLTTIML